MDFLKECGQVAKNQQGCWFTTKVDFAKIMPFFTNESPRKILFINRCD
jgi:hypothetical protein